MDIIDDKKQILDTSITDDERKLRFIDDLTALTRKHRVKVTGCGCCGSPWLDFDGTISQLGKYTSDPGYSYLSWERDK